MASALPLVSVIVPSWQQGRFLHGALESLLQQTYPHVEIIVQDNQSTDETAEVLRAYAPRLSRVVREKDQGQSDALQRGFAHANGNILGWLNADDLLMPDAVARVVEAFETTPSPDVVYGHHVLLTEDGQFIRYFHEIQPFSADVLRNRINFIAQPSTFFSRRAYEHVGGLDASLHYVMDWDLWCRFASSGCRFLFMNHVLSAARYYPHTKTSSGGLKRQGEIFRLNRRYGTTWFPFAAAAHYYRDVLYTRAAFVHGPLRRLWRSLTWRRYVNPTVVHGMAFPDRIVASPAHLRFPAFSWVTGAHLLVQHIPPASSPAALQATLNGQKGTFHQHEDRILTTWQFEPPRFLAGVDLEIHVEGVQKKTAAVRLDQVTLDRAPSPAAT